MIRYNVEKTQVPSLPTKRSNPGLTPLSLDRFAWRAMTDRGCWFADMGFANPDRKPHQTT
jgi:hypothetical protein